MTAEAFAAELRAAEDRLRAVGLSGRAAYAALCRHLAARLGLPAALMLDGPDAPPQAGLDRIPLTAELDLFGLAYERFFPEVFKAERGQFFTPRPVVELMADLAEVRPRDRVLDPTCGSGTFLVVAHGRGADIDGIEVDPELVALCRLNLKLHGANPRAVRRADLFSEVEDERWDVVLANPPFSVEVSDPASLRLFSLAEGRARMSSDTLFLESAWRRLRPGGRLAAVLPRSILANPSHQGLRDWLDERFVRRAVVSLPEGVFRPFGGTAAHAVVVCLQKRPARLRDWTAAIVRHPGYDPTRKTFRRTEPDELGLLRLALAGRGPFPPDQVVVLPPDERRWMPAAVLASSGIAPEVPTVGLGALAPIGASLARPADEPDQPFTQVDLADVDKATGEVSSATVLAGREFKGAKTVFAEGDLLFGRIRPNLNNVAIASRPQSGLPSAMCGSSEWVRLVPAGRPYFALLAARSGFVRAQLSATGGQTRPRVRAEDIPDLLVPDPGDAARALFDEVVGDAHRARLRARHVLDEAAGLYDAFGRGEIDGDALLAALSALRDG